MAETVKDLVAKLKLDSSDFTKGIQQAQKDTGKLDKAASDAGNKGLGGLSKNLVATAASLIGLSGGIAGAIAALNKLKALATEGAGLDRLATAGDNLAASFGANMDDMVAKVQAAAQGTVSAMDIIGSANTYMSLGLGSSAQQMGDLMEVAAFRAKAMGMTTTQAFSDIVRGIGRMSPLILDNLGIVFDSEKVFTEYAASIGKTKDALDDAEKKQALLTATLKEGNKMMKEAGGLARDTATAYEQFSAMSKNSWDQFKMFLGGAFEPVMAGLNRGLFGDQLVELMINSIKGDVSEFETYGEYVGESIAKGIEVGLLKQKQADLLENALMSQGELEAFLEKYVQGSIDYDYYGGNTVKVQHAGDYRATWHRLTAEEAETAKMLRDLNQLAVGMGVAPIDSVEAFANALGFLTEKGWSAASATQELYAKMQALGILQAPSGGMWTAEGDGYNPEVAQALDEKNLEAYNEAMKELSSWMSGDLGESAEKFAEGQKKIADQMSEVNKEIALLKSWGATDEHEKVQALQEKYASLAETYDQNAEDHQEATRRIIFNLLEIEFAQQGITDSEFFYNLAEQWGLIDTETRDAMLAASEFAKLYESDMAIPLSLITELGLKMENLPDEIRTRVFIDQFFTQTGEAYVPTGTGGQIFGNIEQHAVGGGVFAGELLNINERGGEGFIPSVAGRIVPASEMRGGGTDSEILEYLINRLPDANDIAVAVRDALILSREV